MIFQQTFIEGMPIPVGVQSKAYVFGGLIPGTAGLNRAEVMDIGVLCSLCIVQVAPYVTT